MTKRSEPRRYPYPPVTVFDALLALLPDSDYQVIWADRGLGLVTAVTSSTSPRVSMYHTVALRPLADGTAVVTVQVTSRHTFGLQDRLERKEDFTGIFGLVDQALARSDQVPPPQVQVSRQGPSTSR